MDQLRELLDREARGDFSEDGLGADIQWFADNWQIVRGLRTGTIKLAKPASLPTIYDQSLGLRELIERAVGKRNLRNINADITKERFPLSGTVTRTVNLRVEPFLANETGEQAAKRLIAAGHILANTGDLAGFQHDHPKEVEKWNWVFAISEDSRWTNSDDSVLVPYGCVDGAHRSFVLGSFRIHFYSCFGVLVRCESEDSLSLSL